jgi:hypothetical protein
LTSPSGDIDVTHAMGRGTTIPVNRRYISGAGILDASISIQDFLPCMVRGAMDIETYNQTILALHQRRHFEKRRADRSRPPPQSAL